MDQDGRYSADGAYRTAWGQKLDQNCTNDRQDIKEVFIALAQSFEPSYQKNKLDKRRRVGTFPASQHLRQSLVSNCLHLRHRTFEKCSEELLAQSPKEQGVRHEVAIESIT